MKSDKILHQKSSGLYNLTRRGDVMQYAIQKVSRHELDKPFFSYVNWLQPIIFRLMSGHERNIPVTIVQDEVDFPFIIDDEIVNAFFVERVDHLEELRSEIGCDCKCSSHFLTEVLPYVVKVILQDGSYWLNKHSNHWISHRIKEGLNNIDDVSKVNVYNE